MRRGHALNIDVQVVLRELAASRIEGFFAHPEDDVLPRVKGLNLQRLGHVAVVLAAPWSTGMHAPNVPALVRVASVVLDDERLSPDVRDRHIDVPRLARACDFVLAGVEGEVLAQALCEAVRLLAVGRFPAPRAVAGTVEA